MDPPKSTRVVHPVSTNPRDTPGVETNRSDPLLPFRSQYHDNAMGSNNNPNENHPSDAIIHPPNPTRVVDPIPTHLMGRPGVETNCSDTSTASNHHHQYVTNTNNHGTDEPAPKCDLDPFASVRMPPVVPTPYYCTSRAQMVAIVMGQASSSTLWTMQMNRHCWVATKHQSNKSTSKPISPKQLVSQRQYLVNHSTEYLSYLVSQ